MHKPKAFITPKMRRIALVFPGQGSQFIGMGKALSEEFPSARMVFEEVDEALNFNLSKLMFAGEQHELNKTSNAQPAILAHSIAHLHVLQQELNFTPETAFGHSLGEFTAMAALDVLSLEQAARLVRHRGSSMEQATSMFGAKSYAMIALLPIGVQDAANVCSQALQGTRNLSVACQVANINSPTQVVISGTREEVEAAASLAKSVYGVKVAKELLVGAPFHSIVMEAAKQQLRQFFDSIDFHMKDPPKPLLTNVSGEALYDKAAIKENAIKQLDSTVQWPSCIESAYNGLKIDLFLEIGGNVTSTFTKRCLEALSDDTNRTDVFALLYNDHEQFKRKIHELDTLIS